MNLPGQNSINPHGILHLRFDRGKMLPYVNNHSSDRTSDGAEKRYSQKN